VETDGARQKLLPSVQVNTLLASASWSPPVRERAHVFISSAGEKKVGDSRSSEQHKQEFKEFQLTRRMQPCFII